MKPYAPLVAIVMILIPVLYVGSYLALKQPRMLIDPHYEPYRFGGKYAEVFFYPIEKIDRKLRPNSWSTYPFQLGSLDTTVSFQ